MKILVIGDCHGEVPEIPETSFDAVLAVGDICGGTDEMRKYMFEAIDSEKYWYELMGEEEAKEEVKASIREGHKILQKLESLGVPVYVVPGNWDWTSEDEGWEFLDGRGYPEMISDYSNVHDLNFELETLNGVDFIGYGPCSGPEVPQYEDDKPDSEEELEEIREAYEENKEELETLFEQSNNETVFLSHNAPHDTRLDMIDNPDSPKDGRHYGSLIVKELVEAYQPVYNVAGHMHESEGEEELGDTTCINTGFHNSLILNLENGAVKHL